MDIRMMQAQVVVLFTMVAIVPNACLGQAHTDRGAILGGVTGALAGAGIGKHNKETAAGALIGGAVGLVTGAAIGNAMDERDRRAWAAERYAHQQRVQQYSRAVSSHDVVAMTRNGVSPDVIINQIRQYGTQSSLTVQDVISLHRQGVDESVITAMQQSASEPAALPARPIVRQPVVVEEYHYVEPAPRWHYYPPVPHYHFHDYHRRHYSRPSVSWGVSVRH
jgi:outer membrane lipoprotein SlyB